MDYVLVPAHGKPQPLKFGSFKPCRIALMSTKPGCATGVIGATGFVGGAVVLSLTQKYEASVSFVLRLPVGVIEDVHSGIRPNTAELSSQEFRQLDFYDQRTFAPAMSGIKKLFLMRPPANGDVKRWVFPLLDVALRADVKRIVFLSVSGAETRAYLPHAKIEARLAHLASHSKSKVGILRPGFFAQNLLSAYREDISDDDRLYVCAADSRVAFVDTEDFGAAGARALVDGCLDGKAATLTGPSALTFGEVAALLSEALGRPIKYVPASIHGFFCHWVFHKGAGLTEAAIITALHAGLRRGNAESMFQEMSTASDRSATSVAQFFGRFVNAWDRTPGYPKTTRHDV